MLARVALLVLVLSAGCTAIRPLDPIDAASGPDASGTGDGGGLDAASPDDAATDAAVPDAYASDVGTDDASSTDAGGLDAALDPDTGCPPEVCGGGDEDCDGMVDEAGAIGSMSYYPDVDLDNYGDDLGLMMLCRVPSMGRWVMRGGDCDDNNRQVNPSRSETCNGRDDDCNGLIDDGLFGCSTTCTPQTYGGHTYQFCMGPRTQTDAAIACGPTGHLVDIGDAAENAFIQMEAMALGLGVGGTNQGVWIGLMQSGAGYTWTDGSVATYLPWDPLTAEPNGTGPCVRMRSSSGLWADFSCSGTYPYICETP